MTKLPRDIQALLHLHLQKLEDAGLVTSRLELSDDGKALNYFEVTDFNLQLTAEAVARVADSVTANSEK